MTESLNNSTKFNLDPQRKEETKFPIVIVVEEIYGFEYIVASKS